MGKQKQKIYNPDPKNRIKSNNWQFWAIIALPVIYAVVFAYIPMAGILIAFEDYSPRGGIFGSDWVGLKWFQQFLTSTSSVRVIKNTLILGVYSLIVNFPLPILLAIGLNELRSVKYRKFIQMVTYAPYCISVVVMVGMMMQMMDLRTGIINVLLQKIGCDPVNFFGNVKLFRPVADSRLFLCYLHCSPVRCKPGASGGSNCGRRFPCSENLACGYPGHPSHRYHHADLQLCKRCKHWF